MGKATEKDTTGQQDAGTAAPALPEQVTVALQGWDR